MNDCLFCKIAQKEVVAKIVTESENFLAFLDIHPHAPGHTLIIPKDHYPNLRELPFSLGREFVQIIQETERMLMISLQTDCFTLGINEGALAGQVIQHLHFHLIPRFKDDGGGSIHSVVFNQPKESLEDIYLKIKNASQS